MHMIPFVVVFLVLTEFWASTYVLLTPHFSNSGCVWGPGPGFCDSAYLAPMGPCSSTPRFARARKRKAQLKDWIRRPRNIKHPNYVAAPASCFVGLANS